MVDKINFMETLRSVAEITKTSNEPLSRDEIQQYFASMDLSKEQQEMVYQYLLTPQTEEQETESSPNSEEETSPFNDSLDDSSESNTSEEDPEIKSEELSDSSFFQMYLEDVNELPEISTMEETQLYQKLQSGDEYVLSFLSDLWLKRVIEISKEYATRNVNMEDVVQEGNIGLLIGLNNLLGNTDCTDIDGYLTQSIKESMELYIDEILSDDDWENTVLAKATLIHEAINALAEELGHAPSLAELCNYTKLSEEEIKDILSLSKEKA